MSEPKNYFNPNDIQGRAKVEGNTELRWRLAQLKAENESLSAQLATLRDAAQRFLERIWLTPMSKEVRECFVGLEEVLSNIPKAADGYEGELLLKGACQLVRHIGWSTGHADTFEELVKETEANKAELKSPKEVEQIQLKTAEWELRAKGAGTKLQQAEEQLQELRNALDDAKQRCNGLEIAAAQAEERLREIAKAKEQYEADPVNIYDRPSSWEKLEHLLAKISEEDDFSRGADEILKAEESMSGFGAPIPNQGANDDEIITFKSKGTPIRAPAEEEDK